MTCLIKSELYKIIHEKIFLILSIIAACLGIVTMFLNSSISSEYGVVTGDMALISGMGNISVAVIISSIFLAVNIGNEFSDRTLQASIARVRNRDRILGAKLVVNVFCCMILAIVYPIVLTIATSIKNGWGNTFDMSILVLGTISALEIDAAMIFVCFCLELCISISKIALIINILGIGIGMSILNSISSNIMYLADILRFTPVGYYGSCYTSGTDWVQLLQTTGVSVIFILLLLIITRQLFFKRDFK